MARKHTYHRENCDCSIREVIVDVYGRKIILSGQHAFEYSITVISITGRIVITDFKNGKEARPFRNKEECWNEMLKHQPFGWVKHTSSNEYFYSILEVVDGGCVFVYGPMVPFDEVYEFNTFADGTPFGIKE